MNESIRINCRSFPPNTGDFPQVTTDETGATQVSCRASGLGNICLAKSTDDRKKTCYLKADAFERKHGDVETKVLACRTLNRDVNLVENSDPFQAIFQFAKDGTARCLCPKKGTSRFDEGDCNAVSGITQESVKPCPFEAKKLDGLVRTEVVDCEALVKSDKRFQAVIQNVVGRTDKRVLCTKFNGVDGACGAKSGLLMEDQVPCDK